MLDSSAILVLFFTMLNASPRVIMFSSSLTGILALFLMIPCSTLIERWGLKKSVKYSCFAGCLGFLMIAGAPCFGKDAAIPFALLGTFIYCAQRAVYGSAWYPLLDNFLCPQERGSFFSVMRTGYMISSGILFFLLGLLLGKEPPFWLMQTIISVTGLMILLRWYFVSKFPEDPDSIAPNINFNKALRTSIRNAPLTGFSIYLCLLAVAYTSLLPVTLIYLKKYINMEAGTVQILSSVGIGGSIFGYFVYGWCSRHLKLKWLELAAHALFIFLAVALFALDKSTPGFTLIMGGILFLISFGTSWILCNNSLEYLALARPGNKTMAIAFCQTYHSLGTALGRVGCAVLLGSPLLAQTWEYEENYMCIYQSIFLLIAVIAVFALVMIPILPSFVPKHEDYYNSAS